MSGSGSVVRPIMRDSHSLDLGSNPNRSIFLIRRRLSPVLQAIRQVATRIAASFRSYWAKKGAAGRRSWLGWRSLADQHFACDLHSFDRDRKAGIDCHHQDGLDKLLLCAPDVESCLNVVAKLILSIAEGGESGDDA